MSCFVSVTRLRVRSLRFMLGFGMHALRSNDQVVRARGFRAGALLPDRRLTFWTLTLWDRREDMRAFMTSGPHREAMPHLAGWCDEASVVNWEQPGAELPSWAEAEARMRSEGRASKVRRPSRDHAALTFAPARLGRSAPLDPRPAL